MYAGPTKATKKAGYMKMALKEKNRKGGNERMQHHEASALGDYQDSIFRGSEPIKAKCAVIVLR